MKQISKNAKEHLMRVESEMLQTILSVGQKPFYDAIGVDKSLFSRFVSGQGVSIGQVLEVMYLAGLKVVPSDATICPSTHLPVHKEEVVTAHRAAKKILPADSASMIGWNELLKEKGLIHVHEDGRISYFEVDDVES